MSTTATPPLVKPAASPPLTDMTEAQMREVIRDDMHLVYEIPVQWLNPERLAFVACTTDQWLGLLAADELCRREVGDGYPIVAGGFMVDEPEDVVLLGKPGSGSFVWRPATPDDTYALTVCVIRPTKALPL
ncbi:MAG: hypothetical protein V7603_5020 [Micromonosporaceae bacterium]